jgi:hypothetical protein
MFHMNISNFFTRYVSLGTYISIWEENLFNFMYTWSTGKKCKLCACAPPLSCCHMWKMWKITWHKQFFVCNLSAFIWNKLNSIFFFFLVCLYAKRNPQMCNLHSFFLCSLGYLLRRACLEWIMKQHVVNFLKVGKIWGLWNTQYFTL